MEVYTDAAIGSDVAGLGWEIIVDDRAIEGSRYITDDITSMEGEYFALLDGIRFSKREDTSVIEVYCDCDPLIKKMRVPDGNDQDWYDRRQGCHRLLNKFDHWSLEWTPRSSNSTADRLAYEALEKGRRNI